MTRISDWSVIIVAGGGGQRLGGVDKAGLVLDGRSSLDWILDSLPPAAPVIVSGPERPTSRAVVFRPESPPGGGPVAGIGAALQAVSTPRVVIMGADMPWSGSLFPGLLARFGSAGADAVITVDSDGRQQPLLSAWDAPALRRLLAELGDPRDRPMRELVERTKCSTWDLDPRQSTFLADIDTPADLEAAHEHASAHRLKTSHSTNDEQGARAMDEWIEAVRRELGLDTSVDVDGVLDVARVAAHNVARPAAPVTTYLLGVAVAGGADFEQARAVISDLADHWPSSE